MPLSKKRDRERKQNSNLIQPKVIAPRIEDYEMRDVGSIGVAVNVKPKSGDLSGVMIDREKAKRLLR